MLLGLDVGSSRIKAVLVDESGREVAHAAVATPFVASGDRVQMPVDALFDALARLLADLGDRRRQVVAVGVAGVAESGAPLDAAGRPLAPVIAWHDGRGEEAVAALDGAFGPDLALRTGQSSNTKMTVAKLGWLVADGLDGMDGWLGVPELTLWRLTGARATDYSLAARTGCYDVVTRGWLPEVAACLGFSTDVFAPVAAAGTVMGRITPDGAAWSRLPEGIPVTVAGHDHLAGMAGAGVGPDDVGNSVGTAETFVGRSPTVANLASARAAKVAITLHPTGTEWVALASAARAGLVVEEEAAALGRSPAELDAELPPAWADVLGRLTERAVDAYDRLTGVLGPRARVVVFGGGAASEPWLAAKAAALGVPVVRAATTSAVARGAAAYAGMASAAYAGLASAGGGLLQQQVGQAGDGLHGR